VTSFIPLVAVSDVPTDQTSSSTSSSGSPDPTVLPAATSPGFAGFNNNGNNSGGGGRFEGLGRQRPDFNNNRSSSGLDPTAERLLISAGSIGKDFVPWLALRLADTSCQVPLFLYVLPHGSSGEP